MKTRKSKPARTDTSAALLLYLFPAASRVGVAGTFNDWDAAATPCQKDDHGAWRAELKLPPGRYQFRLVVDGVWTDPPNAGETIDNGFGGRNAILEVAPR